MEADPAWKLAVPLSRQRPYRAGAPLDGGPAPRGHSHVENHALEMMAGPVMGITVSGKSAEPGRPLGRRGNSADRAGRSGWHGAEPAFGFTLARTVDDRRAAAPYLPGPTIVLKRGEPVSITVVNQLPEPTAVHWHGIELESYYDGVAGFAGEGKKNRPRDPARRVLRGPLHAAALRTFIYHTHVDEVRQQQAGCPVRCSSWTIRQRTTRSATSCCW